MHVVTPRVSRPVFFSRSTDDNTALYGEQSVSIMDVDSLYQYEDDHHQDGHLSGHQGSHKRHRSLTEVPLLDLPAGRRSSGGPEPVTPRDRG